jgi:hypothetical protein
VGQSQRGSRKADCREGQIGWVTSRIMPDVVLANEPSSGFLALPASSRLWLPGRCLRRAGGQNFGRGIRWPSNIGVVVSIRFWSACLSDDGRRAGSDRRGARAGPAPGRAADGPACRR